MSGEISLCPHQNCGFHCCTFNLGNYIVLYPGEYEAHTQEVGHLDIIDDDYLGGKRAMCHAADTGTCDHGYKPLDCASYPFFPKPGANGELDLIRGTKCPLPTAILDSHRRWVEREWAALGLEPFLAQVEMVGYELVTEPLADSAAEDTQEPATASPLATIGDAIADLINPLAAKLNPQPLVGDD